MNPPTSQRCRRPIPNDKERVLRGKKQRVEAASASERSAQFQITLGVVSSPRLTPR